MATTKVRRSHPSASPLASITTSTDDSRRTDSSIVDGDEEETKDDLPESLIKLFRFASTNGNICHLLDEGVVARIGVDAVRQWEIDDSSRESWLNQANRALSIACQEDEEGSDGEKTYPFDGASNVHYPMLTTASQQFAARAYPALVRGDKVVGVKVFQPPTAQPSVLEQAKAAPQPVNQQQAIEASVKLQAANVAEQKETLENQAKASRAERVKHYLNWTVFYKMTDWEGETDQLLHQAPIVGAGFKKVYYSQDGLQSDYISSTRLTVHNDTKSIYRSPRITWDFDAYPYEIDQKQRSGEYNEDVNLSRSSDDPEEPRQLIEQQRFEDLDDDGYLEPYNVTIDVREKKVLRIEPAYTLDDIVINEIEKKVIKIDRWLGYSEFFFLPDPKGRYYGIGFGRLLEQIDDSIDTGINQLIDAGNAQIAGGGFMASGVRLQGAGAAGTIYQRPGEYQTVSAPGANLREAIWERTLPNPSGITFQLVELLLGAAKDIASVKDVITGNTPATAPVGTTLALQDQALQVFSAIYQRMYRGFKHEFYLMYHALKRWGTDKDKLEYKEITGGDFDEDFSGDGTDIQPIADPAVVTKQQKIARLQTLIQLAESPVGQAAGMLTTGPAQEIVKEGLNAMDWDRPERFIGAVQPNPELVAKVQKIQADTGLAQAKTQTEAASADLDKAKAGHETALALEDVHKLHRHIAGLPEENPTVDEQGQLPGTTSQLAQGQQGTDVAQQAMEHQSEMAQQANEHGSAMAQQQAEHESEMAQIAAQPHPQAAE